MKFIINFFNKSLEILKNFKEELKRLIQNHIQLIEFDREREGVEDEAAPNGDGSFLKNEYGNEADEL